MFEWLFRTSQKTIPPPVAAVPVKAPVVVAPVVVAPVAAAPVKAPPTKKYAIPNVVIPPREECDYDNIELRFLSSTNIQPRLDCLKIRVNFLQDDMLRAKKACGEDFICRRKVVSAYEVALMDAQSEVTNTENELLDKLAEEPAEERDETSESLTGSATSPFNGGRRRTKKNKKASRRTRRKQYRRKH